MDPTWLAFNRIIEAHTGMRDEAQSLMRYLQYLEGRALEERDNEHKDDEYKTLRRGWCFGTEEFKDDSKEGFVAHLSVLNRDTIIGEPRRMHVEYEAIGLLQRRCEEVGLNLDEKDQLMKNDLRKDLVSRMVTKKTAVTQEWLAAELGMGRRANVRRAVCRIEHEKDSEILKLK